MRPREKLSRVDLLTTVLTMKSTVNPPPCDLDIVVLKIDGNGGVRLQTDDEQTEDGKGDRDLTYFVTLKHY